MKIAKKAPAPVQAGKYAEGRKYIRAAIDSLGKVAKDDPKAKEAIANLGVVFLDLDK
ncbi:hypothetical protein [uncultured Duncaniella sp.]|uniref:hypothetical protein n=1 Tax=uncultured Duncaniella sp. TaxID=2768039 RepID=UPI00261F8D4D|nr:hypothetical protein [uncultured Duncaniella sp.]